MTKQKNLYFKRRIGYCNKRQKQNIFALLKVATCRNFLEGGVNEERNNVVGFF